jgi:hypothetical protein
MAFFPKRNLLKFHNKALNYVEQNIKFIEKNMDYFEKTDIAFSPHIL